MRRVPQRLQSTPLLSFSSELNRTSVVHAAGAVAPAFMLNRLNAPVRPPKNGE